MRYDPATIDYLDLVSAARELDVSAADKTLRLAVVADFATQHLVPPLKVLFARNGIRAEIYEADYDSIDTDILNPASELYAFEPKYVAILVATEKLKARLYHAEDRLDMADQEVGRFVNLWDTLKQHSGATVIQGNFVTPSERAFGHYEMKVADSIGSVVADINRRITLAARDARSVLLCDVDHLAGEVGRQNWSDETLWTLSKGLCRLDYLPLLAQAIVDIAMAGEGSFAKCVVLDLDNTLWGGVIGDDGLSGIVLGGYDEGEAYVGFQRFLKELKRRGIILAVVSKNDEHNALAPFREHPNMVLKEDDIAVFVANWENKADNIRTIQSVLNIGFDSMVFIDDNPMERDLVRQFLPEVVIPELSDDPALYLRSLAQQELFETASYSSADRDRPTQYREEARRTIARTAYTDINDYLGSLAMTIKLERFAPATLPRIAQLIQRSNQFNLTTRRYNEAACEAMMQAGDACIPFTVTLADKFGDYGLIAVVVLKPDGNALEIDTFLMSCRVLKRGVEQFVMNQIFGLASRLGLACVVGRYLRSAKNGMVQNFYADFGFRQVEGSDGGDTVWALEPSAYAARTTFMTPLALEL
jgi:FkbH-like protein